MSDYLKFHGTMQTPQSEPIPGSTQVPNSAGGYAWQVDCWTRLRRFLILGSEGGSYYANERELTRLNVAALHECIQEDGERTVREIVAVSQDGRAPKNELALFALAACAAAKQNSTRAYALEALPLVARIGTHLFQFCAYVELFRGWGRGLRRAVSRWYEEKPADQLAYQVIKYRSRGGWSHRDLLRLAHPASPRPEWAAIYDWVTHGVVQEQAPELIKAHMEANSTTRRVLIPALIREHNLPRESIPTEELTKPEVWEALLERMPITAMVRNLGNMTRLGLLTPTSGQTGLVLERLADSERLRKGRVHPIQMLVALTTYASGEGYRGRGTWAPVPAIVDALDRAFYSCFGNVEETGQRYLLGLDISPSMGTGRIVNTMLTPRMGAAAMALVTAATEKLYECVAFAGRGPGYGRRGGLMPFPISPRQRLDDLVQECERLAYNYSATDCSLPIRYATEYQREVDMFIVYTDSETWSGDIHPAEALREYRRKSGIDAKLIVVGMVSNQFSIADPNDAGMLDVVGFDTATPRIMAEFAQGRV